MKKYYEQHDLHLFIHSSLMESYSNCVIIEISYCIFFPVVKFHSAALFYHVLCPYGLPYGHKT